MSIAVTAVIKPSRVLFGLVGFCCLVVCIIGSILSLGWIGDLSTLQKIIIAGCGFSCAFLAFSQFYRGRKTIRIDISGAGKIWLTHYSVLETVNPTSEEAGSLQENEGVLVQIMEGSTLWSNLLLLQLRSERGDIYTLPILPDCVTSEVFRALSVAFRWIAMQEVQRD